MSTDDPGTEPAAGSRSRWRWMATWGVCCVVVLAATFVLGGLVRSPWQDAVENSTATPVVTAVVEQRTLSPDATAVVGEVALGSTTTVAAATGAEIAVVTAGRKNAGDSLLPGEALVEVSGRPVIALALPFRLYRDLVPGASTTSSPDVAAVQQALADLGLYHGSVDGLYGHGTAEAVSTLYKRAGVTPPSPSAEALAAAQEAGTAATAAGTALSTAADELTAATTALDLARSARGAATDPDSAAQADTVVTDALARVATATAAREAARTARGTAAQELAQAQLAAAVPLPMAEVIRVPATGVTVIEVAAVGTELVGTETALARLRAGEPTATVRVGASDAEPFTPGATVSVTGTTDTTLSSAATISEVGPFVAAPTDSGAPPGYDVTVLLPPEQPFADGQDVSVTAATADPGLTGLTVPLIAVRDDAEGSYVLVPAAGGEQPHRTPVTVEGTADGYAVVTGDGLVEGTTVVVSDGT